MFTTLTELTKLTKGINGINRKYIIFIFLRITEIQLIRRSNSTFYPYGVIDICIAGNFDITFGVQIVLSVT
jgi:hypothetical protein